MRIKKKRFLCDVDGITSMFAEAAIKVMTRISGKEVLLENILTWEVTDVLEDQQHREQAKAEFRKEGFALEFELYDGAQSAIRILNEITDFYFVTSPMPLNKEWYRDRHKWLEEHFGVADHQVNFVKHKFIVKGDFILEDSADNAVRWAEEYPNGTALLWDRPWNRTCTHPRVVRVSTWAEVIDIVDKVHQTL